MSRRRPATTRVALLLHAGSLSAALWLVFAAWPHVAWSSPWVMPVTLTIYGAAWMAILLTPVALWQSLSFARASGGTWVTVKEMALAAMLVVLSLFSLYWRIAGTTLEL
jgi:hypothetical protein